MRKVAEKLSQEEYIADWEVYYDDYEEADDWASYGFSADDSVLWWNENFEPEEAKEWRDVDTYPIIARRLSDYILLHKLNLTPSDIADIYEIIQMTEDEIG